jgi:hypothetical protein
MTKKANAQHGFFCKCGWTLAASVAGSLFGFGSRLDVGNLAFSCYLHFRFFNRFLFRAGRSMNATPAQSPVRWWQPV